MCPRRRAPRSRPLFSGDWRACRSSWFFRCRSRRRRRARAGGPEPSRAAAVDRSSLRRAQSRIFTISFFNACFSAAASTSLCSFTCWRSAARISLVVRTPMSALEQRGFELLQQLGVNGPVAGEQLLDARGQLGARFADRLLQPLEERRLLLFFVFAEE